MKKIFEWIKANKLTSALIVLVLFMYFYNSPTVSNVMYKLQGYDGGYDMGYGMEEDVFYDEMVPSSGVEFMRTVPGSIGAPTPSIKDRMVVTTSSLSLVVKDVREAIADIKSFTKTVGGYMVNSSQSAPEGPVSGYITIRVPVDALESTLDYLRGKAVKVVNEDIMGTDITDQYVDVAERLETLEGTKAKYESILEKATSVDDILMVTNQILYIQDQIDNLKGSMKYMEETSSSTLITVYLSTDEFELPYAPEQPWRPEVVFKYAVRSLVTNLREAGSFVIWLGVYSVIWVPAIAVALYLKKRMDTKKK